jgi:hypothetical protein
MGKDSETLREKISHSQAYKNFPASPTAYRAATSDETLKILFEAAVVHAEDRIAWYERKSGEQSVVAKSLRLWAIIFFSLGTMAPIVLSIFVKLAASNDANQSAAVASWPFAEIGYVLLAVAGALVVFDQFFDASASWMRFRQAQARLEVLLADFRFSWARLLASQNGAIVDGPAAGTAVNLLRTFVVQIEITAEAETKEWAEQFRARIDSFDRNPDLRISHGSSAIKNTETEYPLPSDLVSPGSSQTNTATTPEANAKPDIVTIRLAIDDINEIQTPILTINDSATFVPADGQIELPLEAGHIHRIAATGFRAGKQVRASLELTPTIEDEGKPVTLQLE